MSTRQVAEAFSSVLVKALSSASSRSWGWLLIMKMHLVASIDSEQELAIGVIRWRSPARLGGLASL
jgi:hypothetical protein